MQINQIKLIVFGLLIIANLNVFAKKNDLSRDDRPNIIFILTDDQRWSALGYAGNQLATTPEMDKLAQAGTYFRNAVVTTPICAASRYENAQSRFFSLQIFLSITTTGKRWI